MCRLSEIHEEGGIRYEKHIPPGYKDQPKDKPRDKDQSKEAERRFGDLVLWFQLLDEAKSRNQPVILVGDDTKEDWWSYHKGMTVGPRPELIHEAREKAGVRFYLYEPYRFMEEAQQQLRQPVEAAVVEEAKEISESIKEKMTVRVTKKLRWNFEQDVAAKIAELISLQSPSNIPRVTIQSPTQIMLEALQRGPQKEDEEKRILLALMENAAVAAALRKLGATAEMDPENWAQG